MVFLRKLFRPELADKAYEELVKISQQLKNADRLAASCIAVAHASNT